MNCIVSHFPDLSPVQTEQLSRLGALYSFWNEQINVISRKDIENLYLHHVLHSLSIARFIRFKPGTEILDAGTGGGFPGLPLAILFPECRFTLADSIGKKIRVVKAISEEIGLTNISPVHGRVEELRKPADFVVSRAVTSLPAFVPLVKGLIRKEGFNDLPNGIIYLKGGELEEELKPFEGKYTIIPISGYFEEPFFETKKIIFIPMK